MDIVLSLNPLILKNSQEEIKQLFSRYEFIIDPGQEPIRVDLFLVNRIEQVTRTKVQKAILENQVLINNFPAKASQKLKPYDIVEVFITKNPEEFLVIPEDIPLDIVFEDEYLMVINKPVGLVVHPGIGNFTGTLLNALAYKFDANLTMGDKRPWLVHRIDKNTSGLIVVAKDDITLNGLAVQFKNHTIRRVYNALVWGVPKEDSGTISTYIGRDPYERKRFSVHESEENAKWAITHYKLLKSFHFTSLIECKLETGRTHQIRVHMRHLGHPLFNDEKYGGHRILKGVVYNKYQQFVNNCFDLMPRHALHAKHIGFQHPVTKKELDFTSEFPEDFAKVLHKWEQVADLMQFK